MLLGATLLIARRLADADGNPGVVPVVMGGLCLKIVGSVMRYYVSKNVYGTGDFFEYDKWGHRIADGLRQGHLI